MSLSEVGFGDASASSSAASDGTVSLPGPSCGRCVGPDIRRVAHPQPHRAFAAHDVSAPRAGTRGTGPPPGRTRGHVRSGYVRLPAAGQRRPPTDTFDSRYVRPFGSAPAKTEAARRTFVPFDPSIARARPGRIRVVRLGDRPAYPLPRRESRRARWRVKSGYRVLFACCGVKNKTPYPPLHQKSE